MKFKKFELQRLALCKINLSSEGKLPEWIELIPPGAEINAIDGRKFKNSKPDQIVEAFKNYGLSLPIDYEHATEKKAPNGEEAPAAGWITEIENRDGAIWGKVEWTNKGAVSLSNKEYRYISPAFILSKVGEIVELVSAGLTNKPALTQLAQLANAQGEEDSTMKLDKELCLALGLPETATLAEALDAIGALKKAYGLEEEEKKKMSASVQKLEAELARASTPDLTKFVPRADYEVIVARAEKAEKEISDQKTETLKKEIDVEINQALKDGKITPATAEYHRSLCSQEGGLAKFKDFVKVAPIIAPDSNLDSKPTPDSNPILTNEMLEVATRCGLNKETILASLKV